MEASPWSSTGAEGSVGAVVIVYARLSRKF